MRYRLKPDDFTAQETLRDTTMWIATWAVLYGVVTVLGGDPVWDIPPYRTALLVPYSPESWGWLLMAIGFAIFYAMFTGKNRVAVWALLMGSVWNLFFALSFLNEYKRAISGESPTGGIGLGPVVTYIFIAGVFVLRVSTYRRKNATQEIAP